MVSKNLLFGTAVNTGMTGYSLSQSGGDAEAIAGDLVGFSGNLGIDILEEKAVDSVQKNVKLNAKFNNAVSNVKAKLNIKPKPPKGIKVAESKPLTASMKQLGGNVIKKLGEKLTQKAAQQVGSKLASRLAMKVGTQVASFGAKLGATATGTLTAGAAAAPATGGLSMVVAAAIMVLQIGMAVFDMLFDPWKNYFNKDLDELKDSLDDGLRSAMKETGANWPLEIKPAFFLSDEDVALYQELVQQYYDDRGIIHKEVAKAEEENILALQQVRRTRKLYTVDEDGNVNSSQPIFQAVALNSSTQQNMALLIATAAAIKKGYTSEEYKQTYTPRFTELIEYERPWYHSIVQYIKSQWISLIISTVCISLICSSIIAIINSNSS
jgi:lysozyme family protein